jgi:hypothetical protein
VRRLLLLDGLPPAGLSFDPNEDFLCGSPRDERVAGDEIVSVFGVLFELHVMTIDDHYLETTGTYGMGWEEARRYAESLGSGWRLPSMTEMIHLSSGGDGVIEELIREKYRLPSSAAEEDVGVLFWTGDESGPRGAVAIDPYSLSPTIREKYSWMDVMCIRQASTS